MDQWTMHPMNSEPLNRTYLLKTLCNPSLLGNVKCLHEPCFFVVLLACTDVTLSDIISNISRSVGKKKKQCKIGDADSPYFFKM